MREIKLEIIFKGKIFGYERLTKTGWEWTAIELNQDNVERWTNGVLIHSNEYIRRQYTGLKDKNGKEIYEGDLLRVKGTMGNKSEYTFDAIYRVLNISYTGFSITFEKLFNEIPDSVDNSYPINTSASFKYCSLTEDYRNGNYEKLAFNETHGKNNVLRTSWKQHDYTNDVEVIGNIHENPELLK